MVTDKGEYKKIQPYPIDAVEVELQDLDEAARQRLLQLERELTELKGVNSE
jgi:hypothetical protein